jgi:hypothetical protein
MRAIALNAFLLSWSALRIANFANLARIFRLYMGIPTSYPNLSLAALAIVEASDVTELLSRLRESRPEVIGAERGKEGQQRGTQKRHRVTRG